MTAKKFSRKQIFNRRGQLFDILRRYVDLQIVGDVVFALTNDLIAALPTTVSRNAVFESVRVMAGTTLTTKAAAKFAWRLAGNMDALIAGDPVLPWTRQLHDEIVPVCVERVVPMRRKDKHGYLFYCRVLAGTPCTELITQFFSANSCRAISRVVGFATNSWGPYQYGGIGIHFVNLLFFAHIDAAKSRDKPAFFRVSVSSSMLKANKQLLGVRCRLAPCPLGYEHACANCPVGYDECSFAVHAKTYVETYCRTCRTDSFFDPESDGLMCVNCSKVNNHAQN